MYLLRAKAEISNAWDEPKSGQFAHAERNIFTHIWELLSRVRESRIFLKSVVPNHSPIKHSKELKITIAIYQFFFFLFW